MRRTIAWLALITLVFSCSTSASELAYTNWENHPLHPLDTSPSGEMLAVAHTADNRVQLFDISTGMPVPVGHVVVGVDPVTVRFLSDNELWVVNHISDSISIIDIASRRVRKTLHTADEPFDVVFAGNPRMAFVSCSQANLVQAFELSSLNKAPLQIPIDGEDPRGLAVSPDGGEVYVAIFESGNATTILPGATAHGDDPPNVVLRENTPYGGVNPPPNDGTGFSPKLTGGLPPGPMVGHIVRKNEKGKWMDDNDGDWTKWVSGNSAAQSGRVTGWDMPDHDIAVIDTATFDVSYISSLMNIGMAIAVHPVSGNIHLVGTDATNEVRFEPNLTGTFVHVKSAVIDADDFSDKSVMDLNPHLDYEKSSISQANRDKSIGTPRSLVWSPDGETGVVTGMGSNNLIAIGADGSRDTSVKPIETGEGPIGVAFGPGAVYIWNHFESSLSVIDSDTREEVARLSAFSPLPEAIRQGRPLFYDTHRTSGLGQLSCASCHIDGRIDRLAWDLSVPNGAVKEFNQNCGTSLAVRCGDFHPMKGPMTTQTLQDIIGHEPLHWRGDRDGLEEFNGAFVGLLGDDSMLTADEMQQFKNFLDTITFPPNPFRNIDNSLSTKVDLTGHYSPGGAGFSAAGTPLPNGDAVEGLDVFHRQRLSLLPGQPADPQNCSGCHSMPTGMGPNGLFQDPFANVILGGSNQPLGPNGEEHLLVLGNSTLANTTMKIPQLRNLYEKTGFETKLENSRGGFGFLHDGSVDSLAHFVGLEVEFRTADTQEMADLVAFLLSFSGSDLPEFNDAFTGTLLDSLDTHAGVGQQVTVNTPGIGDRVAELLDIANVGGFELVAHQGDGRTSRSWLYQRDSEQFEPDDSGESLAIDDLMARAEKASEVTFTAVPNGLGDRLALDRDGDGVRNGDELRQGSDPADPASKTLVPASGLWYNPGRDGAGIDLERNGDAMVAVWYTYNEDMTPHFYLAQGTLVGNSWTGDLYNPVWNGSSYENETVGTLTMTFSDATHAEFKWEIGSESGTEDYQRLVFGGGFTPQDYTSLWFDPGEPGWGLSLDSQGATRVAIVYFYDVNREPRWVLGSGSNASGSTFDMLSFTGFCPWCEVKPTSTGDGGTLRFDALASPMGHVDMAVDYPATAGSEWVRDTDVTRLTQIPFDPYAR